MDKNNHNKGYNLNEEEIIKLSFEEIHLENSVNDIVMSKIFESESKSKERDIKYFIIAFSFSICAVSLVVFQKFILGIFNLRNIFNILDSFNMIKKLFYEIGISFLSIQFSSIIILTIIVIFLIMKGSVLNEN